MKRLLVLGGGTAGTMAVNKLRPLLPRDEWKITVVDSAETHYYQPGFLFIPFGIYRPDEVAKPSRRFIPAGVESVTGEIDRVLPDANAVLLADGTELRYDYLVIATGTDPAPRPRRPGWPRASGAGASTSSTPTRARSRSPSRSSPGTAAGWSSTSSRCRSSARSRRWSSPSWPTPSSPSRACATGSRSLT